METITETSREQLFAEWPLLREITSELSRDETEVYISSLLEMDAEQRANHIKSVEDSLNGQLKKWPLLASMPANERENLLDRIDEKMEARKAKEEKGKGRFDKLVAIALIAVAFGIYFLLEKLGMGYGFRIFAIIVYTIPAMFIVFHIRDKNSEEKFVKSLSALEKQAYDFLSEQQVKENIERMRKAREYEAQHNQPVSIATGAKKSKSGTKTIVKNAAVGWVIGGPAGGIIGAIVGKNKVDARNANR